MNIRMLIYLISTILLCTFVGAVGVGSIVTYPAECDSGFAKVIPSTNDTITLVCVSGNTPGYTTNPLNILYGGPVSIFSNPISQEAIDIQMNLAETATLWTNADEIYWDYKFNGFINEENEEILGIKQFVTIIWGYITAFLILMLEVVKLIFYLIQITVVIYVLFTLIPNAFFKLRDALVRSYIRKYAT